MMPRRCAGVRPAAVGILASLLLLGATLPAAGAVPGMLLLDAAQAGRKLVVVGERGSIFLSRDQAATWQPVDSGVWATLTAISAGSGGRRLWAVGHDALILASDDGGLTWNRQWQGEDLEDSFLDVLAIDDERVVAVGAYGLYLHTGDAGRTWTRRRVAEDDFHLNRITRGPAGTLYLAGERGTLLRSEDEGVTWTPIPTDYDGSFFGILPLDARVLLAYGLRGHVFQSSDNGGNWTRIEIPIPVLLATAVRRDGGAIVIAGNARTPLVSRDEGTTFTTMPASEMTAIAELLDLPGGRLLAVGETGVSTLEAP